MSSSSDDIRIVEAPAGPSSRQRSISRAGSKTAKPGRPRAGSRAKQEASSDSDEPVFIGSSVGAKLADKFMFKQAARPPFLSRSKSALEDEAAMTNAEAGPSRLAAKPEVKDEVKPSRKRATKTDAKLGLGLNEVLLPELNLEPLPVPSWLGPAKILKELSVCPLCRKQLKPSESGPARWRHISTCLPPLHRPPNPPPDLQRVISAALDDAKAPLGPASLIDYHMKTLGDSTDLASTGTAVLPNYFTGTAAPRTSKKAGKTKAPAATVGLRIATVEAADERVDWDSQIDERLGDFIGHPSPSSAKSADLLSSPMFPSTQPLGDSTLASQYLHPDRNESPSPQTPSSPLQPATGNLALTERLGDDADGVVGEAREPMGASPGQSDRQDWEGFMDTDRSGSESKKERAAFYGEDEVAETSASTKNTRRSTKSPARPRTPIREIPSSPETEDEISPNTTITSDLTITPRHLYTRASRASTSPAPAPSESLLSPRQNHNAQTAEDQVNEWGDEAMLSWDWGEGGHSDDEAASSLLSLDSGLSDDDLEAWGRDAVIDFTYESEDSSHPLSIEYGHIDVEEGVPDMQRFTPESAAVELEVQVVAAEETKEELVARGMPDYGTWDIPKLQKLTEKYGYRPMTKHAALVKIAIDCWKAINPRPEIPSSKPKAKKRTPRSALATSQSESSVSSADVPLATTKAKRKGKAKAIEVDDTPEPTPAVELEQQFYNLIHDDRELYTRILRYEPISFDEFISKALASGITHRSYKARLVKFLDMQGITYYTQDPTGQRRRR